MTWNLAGSYSETCSCELMCPCNTSLDHGATYDFCLVTLAFNIREGSVDGASPRPENSRFLRSSMSSALFETSAAF